MIPQQFNWYHQQKIKEKNGNIEEIKSLKEKI